MKLLDNNESKKCIYRIYNDISKELFGFGTTNLRATIDDNLITLVAKHRRSPRSSALEMEAPSLKLEVDFRMSLLYKKILRERLEQQLALDIEALFRDYDGATQWAITNIMLNHTK